jgi:hypothetical protein
MSVLLDAEMDHDWLIDDVEFARQRVSGVHPLMIKKVPFTHVEKKR